MEKYTKVRNIGTGNMGTCALARNNEDGRLYVVKQVDLSRMSKKERQQSLNEARLLSSLRHPNVIQYVDSFLARRSNHLCIVMEYADGGDLNARIKRNGGVNFGEGQVLDWFIQLVLSLHYVHQRKILHRDVKAQNVFLTSDNVVKLGDFGIARTLSNTYEQAKTFVGTPYYLSPELILERPYDTRSDVWALGVVLYELLTLRHPFNANDMRGLMQRILRVQYEPVSTLYSADLRNVLVRLLVKEPSQRMQLADVLELPLVHRRLCEWVQRRSTLPHAYVDTLVAQSLLPASVMMQTRRVTPPPRAAPQPRHPSTTSATTTMTTTTTTTTTTTSSVTAAALAAAAAAATARRAVMAAAAKETHSRSSSSSSNGGSSDSSNNSNSSCSRSRGDAEARTHTKRHDAVATTATTAAVTSSSPPPPSASRASGRDDDKYVCEDTPRGAMARHDAVAPTTALPPPPLVRPAGMAVYARRHNGLPAFALDLWRPGDGYRAAVAAAVARPSLSHGVAAAVAAPPAVTAATAAATRVYAPPPPPLAAQARMRPSLCGHEAMRPAAVYATRLRTGDAVATPPSIVASTQSNNNDSNNNNDRDNDAGDEHEHHGDGSGGAVASRLTRRRRSGSHDNSDDDDRSSNNSSNRGHDNLHRRGGGGDTIAGVAPTTRNDDVDDDSSSSSRRMALRNQRDSDTRRDGRDASLPLPSRSAHALPPLQAGNEHSAAVSASNTRALLPALAVRATPLREWRLLAAIEPLYAPYRTPPPPQQRKQQQQQQQQQQREQQQHLHESPPTVAPPSLLCVAARHSARRHARRHGNNNSSSNNNNNNNNNSNSNNRHATARDDGDKSCAFVSAYTARLSAALPAAPSPQQPPPLPPASKRPRSLRDAHASPALPPLLRAPPPPPPPLPPPRAQQQRSPLPEVKQLLHRAAQERARRRVQGFT